MLVYELIQRAHSHPYYSSTIARFYGGSDTAMYNRHVETRFLTELQYMDTFQQQCSCYGNIIINLHI